ncbi:hypothetical protein [uncultured Paraprevotella sp.]|uniref:hypothetical protein n=1 Tax=uncultured Paraprevotella sp. TaxID=910951 RepID=UPI00259B1584|nr:hypothetical protein [uncultured Paraprevotella sp.]
MEVDTSAPSALALSSAHCKTKNHLEHIGKPFGGCFYGVLTIPWDIFHKALS